MISLQIKNTKSFMNTLLVSEQFDSFEVEEATITTFNTFYIDGHIVKDFYTLEEIDEITTKATLIEALDTTVPNPHNKINRNKIFKFILFMYPPFML